MLSAEIPDVSSRLEKAQSGFDMACLGVYGGFPSMAFEGGLLSILLMMRTRVCCELLKILGTLAA